MYKINVIYPQYKDVVPSIYPRFTMQMTEDVGDVCYKIEVSDTPDFSGMVIEYNQLNEVSEWSVAYFASLDVAWFVPPDDRPIPGDGQWYYRVTAYEALFPNPILVLSPIFPFTIQGGTYKWRVGKANQEVEFKPSRTTVSEEIVRTGRKSILKRKFTIDFAHMKQEKRDALYAEYDRQHALRFYDNRGNSYWVYWGEVERSLDGTAHQPDKPAFGIDRSNIISGALRWTGTAVFSEV